MKFEWLYFQRALVLNVRNGHFKVEHKSIHCAIYETHTKKKKKTEIMKQNNIVYIIIVAEWIRRLAAERKL